jgi:hypothetical protein
MAGPSRLLKVFFRAPAFMYRLGLGRMLGKRFVAVTHRGRKSGQLRETVLEVLVFDPDDKETVVVSAYGTRAEWTTSPSSVFSLLTRPEKLPPSSHVTIVGRRS